MVLHLDLLSRKHWPHAF